MVITVSSFLPIGIEVAFILLMVSADNSINRIGESSSGGGGGPIHPNKEKLRIA